MPPVMRHVTARPEIERFYHEVTAAAVTCKLSDAELCAVLSSLVGRMIEMARLQGTAEDHATIVDTAIYNLRQGRADLPGLLEAVGKGN